MRGAPYQRLQVIKYCIVYIIFSLNMLVYLQRLISSLLRICEEQMSSQDHRAFSSCENPLAVLSIAQQERMHHTCNKSLNILDNVEIKCNTSTG